MPFGTFYFLRAASGLGVAEVIQDSFRPFTISERFARGGWEGLGAETLAFGGLPQEKIRRSMELFAREAMPRVRDA